VLCNNETCKFLLHFLVYVKQNNISSPIQYLENHRVSLVQLMSTVSKKGMNPKSNMDIEIHEPIKPSHLLSEKCAGEQPKQVRCILLETPLPSLENGS
jgi:hypothetical protein